VALDPWLGDDGIVALPVAELLPLTPLIGAAAALGRTLVESVGEEGRRRDTRAVSIMIGLVCIALFLLAIGEPTIRERVVVMACGATLWLLARVQRDPRVLFAATGAVALLAGAEPRCGLGYVAALVLVLFGQRGLPDRYLQRGGLLFVGGSAAGWLLFGERSTLTLEPSLALRWLDGALHATGPVALVLAATGVVFATLGSSGRRGQGAMVLLALGATIFGGHFDATSALLVALGLGLGLLEASAHLSSLHLPGARLALGPLFALVLVEPLSLRLASADLRWPTLGPVPPQHSMLERSPCHARS